MLTIQTVFSEEELNNFISVNELIDFLHTYLDKFGDSKEAIEKCIKYAFSKESGKGGYVLLGFIEKDLVGAVVMNKTGMAGYIPENVLVYVAVNSNFRNRGIGGQLVEKAVDTSAGNVKLHVEYDNPAKRLYERLGFENKYAEMRFTKENK